MARLTKDEKQKIMTELLGDGWDGAKEEDNSLPFADAANQEPAPSFYDDPEDEDEDEQEGDAAPAPSGQADDDDTPQWAKVLQQQVTATQQENKALRTELQTARYYQQQQQQAPAPQKEEEKEIYWATSQDIEDIEARRQHDMQMVNRLAMLQEYQSFRAGTAALAAELSANEDVPNLEEVIPFAVAHQVFQEYAKNPNQYGGLGRDWRGEFRKMYQEHAFNVMVQRNKEGKAKADELSKRREQKAQQENKNLQKIPKSGQSTQEPKKVEKRGVRSYRDLRPTALKHLMEN